MPNFILFAKLTVLTGFRNRLSWLVSFLALSLAASGLLAAAFSARQPLIVAADVALSGLHFGLLFLTLIWVQELLLKDRDRKTIDWVLAYPVSRAEYLLGKSVGLAALLLIAVLVLAIPVYLLGNWATWGYADSAHPVFGLEFGWVLWGAWLQALVVLSFTIFFFSMSSTPYLSLAVALLFALAARNLGGALDFLLFNPDASEALKGNVLPVLRVIRWLLPDLSALDWRTAFLYGAPLPALRWLQSAMALSYAGIFSVLALMLFKRRQIR